MLHGQNSLSLMTLTVLTLSGLPVILESLGQLFIICFVEFCDLWCVCTCREIKRLNSQFINQFPFESVITCKDLLARICQKGTTVSIIYKTRQFHHLVSVRAY
jgi:hypothetical protein